MPHKTAKNQPDEEHYHCNSLSPPLADIVLFELSVTGFPSKFLNRVY